MRDGAASPVRRTNEILPAQLDRGELTAIRGTAAMARLAAEAMIDHSLEQAQEPAIQDDSGVLHQRV